MTPYDGSGYGHSIYWRSQLKEIAEKNGEKCTCWEKNEPHMTFSGDSDFKIVVSCKPKQETCIGEFDLTQREILEKFKNFHKV